MAHYDDILEISLDNYGLVTYRQAEEAGIAGSELARFVEQGRLSKLGHGLYQVTMRIPTVYDRYAQAVALAGEGSILFRTAVLALLGLSSVNPVSIEVASTKRIRRNLPPWVEIVSCTSLEDVTRYHGIPCQNLFDAFVSCKQILMSERILDGAREAHSKGLLLDSELSAIEEMIFDA